MKDFVKYIWNYFYPVPSDNDMKALVHDEVFKLSFSATGIFIKDGNVFEVSVEQEQEDLKEQLSKAIKSENYKEAARIRDVIKEQTKARE